MLSPPRPEKIAFVSDGTSRIPTENVPITTNACRPYTRYSPPSRPAGSVVKNWNTNRSKIIRNANATTGTNEYWMNALNHDQNSQSSFGTMKNGTKIGPSRAHTALAMRPKATTASETAFASVTTISSNQ